MAPRVICRVCETKTLERVEETELSEAGYLCRGWEKDTPGEGCNRLIKEDKYTELVEEMQAEASTKVEGSRLMVEGEASPIRDAKRQNVAALLK